jgi:thiol:disulfide interchange protein
MPTSNSQSVSVWVVLAQAAGILFAVWAIIAGYNYFKPPEIPPAIPGQYSDTIQWLSVQEGEAQLKEGKKCVLYDFTAGWCHYCQNLEAEVFEVKLVAQFINQYFIPVRVMDRNQEDGKNPPEVAALQSKYGVGGFPTQVVRYPNGQSTQQVGYAGAQGTVEFLRDAVHLK